MADCELRIICIGNMLHGNDGVGHAVYERLLELGIHKSVELLDGGIGGMTLLPFFKGAKRVLLIDLVKSQHQAGSSFWYPDAVANLPVKANQKGEHGGDLTTLLCMLPVYMDELPEVDLLCISASSATFFNPSLDNKVAQVIDDICLQIQQYINQHLCTVNEQI